MSRKLVPMGTSIKPGWRFASQGEDLCALACCVPMRQTNLRHCSMIGWNVGEGLHIVDQRRRAP